MRPPNLNKLFIIGIGYKPLDEKARKALLDSEVILASERLFEVFRGYEEFEVVKERITVINNIDETIDFIRSNESKRIVLLASGDPMFFGIGRRAVREFGKERVEILPDLSSLQVAFSRIKEPWDDAFLMSLHGGPDPEKRRRLPYDIKEIPLLLQRHNKIAILTDRENNPAEIARVINSSQITDNLLPVMYVCERLGYPDENIIKGSPGEIKDRTFKTPNIVIIAKGAGNNNAFHEASEISFQPLPSFGLTQEEISHSRGLITKDEVRAIVIHKLRPFRNMVFWDIGAGSGSVSLEISRLLPDARVYAIERDPIQIRHLASNREAFHSNIHIIHGEAPEILEGLPSPHRVFIGGSGGRLTDIIEYLHKRIVGGIIALTATTLETLNRSQELLKKKGYLLDVIQVNIARMRPLGRSQHLSAENPVFIITATRA